MKNIFLFCIVLGLVFPCTAQQMTVKAGTLAVSPNTNFYFAGLTLTPSATFNVSNNVLSKDTVVSDTFTNTYVSRTYSFSGAPVFSGTAGIRYQDGELNGLSPSSLVLAGSDGSSFQMVGNTTVDSVNNYVTTSGITSYPMQELILTSGIPLSLRLINISAARQSSTVTVKWETAREYGVKQYDVQRSTDGIHWATAISGIQAKNVPYASRYEATDMPGFDGRLLYRVRQEDVSENVFFSDVVSVGAQHTLGLLAVIPNPAKDNFTIAGLDHANVTGVDLSDAAGHLVRHWQQSQGRHELTGLPAGIYIVRIHTGGKNTISKQIIIR